MEAQKVENNVLVKIKLRDPLVNTIMAVLTLLILCVTDGISRLSLVGSTGWFNLGVVKVPSKIFVAIMFVLCLAGTAFAWLRAVKRQKVPGWLTVIVGVSFVAAFIIWTVAGKAEAVMPLVPLLGGALTFSLPLIFGSLSGVICERTGVINLAIEGQLLFGAFLAAIFATKLASPYMGLVVAPIGGALVAVLLALFAINFRSNQIVVGVVLNMLALGFTNFVYSTVLVTSKTPINSPDHLPALKIPILGDIPVIGPVLFKQSLLVYFMYAAVILVNFFLFKTRWGLRTRACGEHPKAADTVGIKVNKLRWINVIIGGALAGLGGAFFTVGSGLAFSENCSAGTGFIALAAMILGRWNPFGALGASLLFGFATNLGSIMQTVEAPIPSEFLLMTPYIVTILAVAGFVGAVRPPAAENRPYPE